METVEYDIILTVNDREVKSRVTAETTLLDFLRNTYHIEVKRGCDHGDCRAGVPTNRLCSTAFSRMLRAGFPDSVQKERETLRLFHLCDQTTMKHISDISSNLPRRR